MKNLIIIPARGGSKGLPGKNLMRIAGKSLIQRAIESTCQLDCGFDLVISTDSQEIADEAIRFGALVPFLRPDYLATDSALISDVLTHLIKTLAKAGQEYENMILLQPTSPLRTARHVLEAWTLYEQEQFTCLASVKPLHMPLNTLVLKNDSGLIKNFYDLGGNRQETAELYQLNGAIYICKIETFLQTGRLVSDSCGIYEMPEADSIDIDSLTDFNEAQIRIESHQNHISKR